MNTSFQFSIRSFAIGSLFFALPFLLIVLQPANPSAGWSNVALAGQRVAHLSLGYSDGLASLYVWTPTNGLVRGTIAPVDQPSGRDAWRKTGGALPGSSFLGTPAPLHVMADRRDDRNLIMTVVDNGQTSLYASTDRGDTWQLLRGRLPDVSVSTMVFGPDSFVYLTLSDRVIWNSRTANVWLETPPWAPENGSPTSLVVVDSSVSARRENDRPFILVGTDRGRVLRLPTSASSWEIALLPDAGSILQLGVSPAGPQRVYAWAKQTLWRSDDAAATWTRLRDVANWGAPLVLMIPPTNANRLYVAVPQGVLTSADGGLSWGKLGNGLTTTRVHALALDARGNGRLFAATDAGLWQYKLDE